MNLHDAPIWPTTLAQATPETTTDSAPAAPIDTAKPPGAAGADPSTTGDGTTATTTAPGTPGAPGPDGGAPPPSPFGGNFMFIMILIIGMLFIFTMGSGRKEKKRRAAMLEQLTKGAKVQTVGGVLGTIVEVRDDEVVVKVDENSNTRMRFAKSAINAVTSED